MKSDWQHPQRFTTCEGRSIYALPLEVFPNFFANVYLISDGERRILVDCGSGLGFSNDNLVAALKDAGDRFGEPLSLATLDSIFITHAHMDHFGGLPFVRQHTDAPIGVHILDRRVLSHYEERVMVATRHLAVFLERAGVSPQDRDQLMRMYGMAKGHYRSLPVDFTLDEDHPPGEGMRVYHVPGHCPGQVSIEVDDVLLTADHVLSRITPHQCPESITLNMGLQHYLDSLTRVERLSHIRLALGGHDGPMADLPGRVREIKASHERRLHQVLDICADPKSVAEASQALFGELTGYNVLLALEETGAHVEYLYLRGELIAANVEEFQKPGNEIIRYQKA